MPKIFPRCKKCSHKCYEDVIAGMIICSYCKMPQNTFEEELINKDKEVFVEDHLKYIFE